MKIAKISPFVAACEIMNISLDELFSESRKPEAVTARHFIMHYFYRDLKMTSIKIAAVFGKDHATVLHAISQVDIRRDNEKDYSEKFIKFKIKVI